MKTLILIMCLFFAGILRADQYEMNLEPEINEKGRMAGSIVKIVDENSLIISAGARMFSLKGEKIGKDACNNERITFAFIRTGTVKYLEAQIAELKFIKKYSKKELEKEAAEFKKAEHDKKYGEKNEGKLQDILHKVRP